VYVELKKAKEALQDGASVDIDAFKADVRTRHPDISEGAFAFVFGGEKYRNDVITVYAELKKVKEDLLAGTLSFDDFKAYVRNRYPDDHISDAAFDFVFGGEKQRDDIITVSAELEEVKEDFLAGKLSFDAFKADVRTRHPEISDGVFDFVLVREKHNSNVTTVYERLKKVKAAASDQTVDAATLLTQMRSEKPELDGALNFCTAAEKIHDEERTIATAVNEMKRFKQNHTQEDITNCIKGLQGVSVTTKVKAIMGRCHQAKITSFSQQLKRLKRDSLSEITREVFKCNKCKSHVTFFGRPKSDVTCLECKRRGRIDRGYVRSEHRTTYTSVSSTSYSFAEANDEFKQLQEEFKQRASTLKRELERSSVSSNDTCCAKNIPNQVDVLVTHTPEPLHRITYKEQYESEYLGTCDEKGGTIKSVATCDDGSHMLLVVFTQVEHGERWISSRDDKLTILFDVPKFSPEDYYEERLADLFTHDAAQLEQPIHSENTPEPLHRITYKEQYESEYLGTCDEKGGTIKSVATCDDGSHMLLVVFTQVEHGERWISSRDDKLTILFDVPKFSPEDYYEERLADLFTHDAAQLEQSSEYPPPGVSNVTVEANDVHQPGATSKAAAISETSTAPKGSNREKRKRELTEGDDANEVKKKFDGKRYRKICSADECTNQALRGGVCIKHGAKVKLCSAEGCTNHAKKGGVCWTHGAKAERCSSEGCTKFAQKGGVCWRHGANLL
jgi:hypothetical protein